MSEKVYVCSECGYVFPAELGKLIEKKVQVYCEKCGTPFSLKGVKFKEQKFEPIPRNTYGKHVSKEIKSGFDKLLSVFRILSPVPILIFSIFMIVIGFVQAGTGFTIPNPDPDMDFEAMTVGNIIGVGIVGIFISLYDIKRINPKIKKKSYHEIILEPFCLGILGSIIFGTGTLILIKGIFVLIYCLVVPKKKEDSFYDLGLYLKDSLNKFSFPGAIIIIGLALSINFPPEPNAVFLTLLIISAIAVGADRYFKKEIFSRNKYDPFEFTAVLTLGILGVLYFAAGIFILLKAVIIFFLLFGNTHEKKLEDKQQEVITYQPKPTEMSRIAAEKKVREKQAKIQTPKLEEKEKKIEIEDIKLSKKEKKRVVEHYKHTERLRKKLEKEPTSEKEIELQIHESLLPVKNEKDKKVVKEYLQKIFSVLSKDMREQVYELNIPKKEKKEILEELAFLTAEEQAKYIETLIDLYREIPEKLIARIRKLPNVQPEHYEKLMKELSYMDYDEQVKFIEFLEQNAHQ